MGVSACLSWVLAGRQPEALARFYGAMFGTEWRQGLSEGHWIVQLPSGGQLQIYRPSRSRSIPSPGQALAPCLQREAVATGDGCIHNLECWVGEALALGASVEESPRQEPFGVECWLRDPEGNRLLLLVTPARLDQRP